MSQISLGKYHRLLKCSSVERTFSILAIDHRTSLMKALLKQEGNTVGDAILIDFKKDIVSRIGVEADAVIIDPEYGAPQCVAAGLFGGHTKMIMTIDKSGYTGPSHKRNSEVLEGWDVYKSERMGADAVKLLVYFHPQAKTASKIEHLVEKVAKVCNELEIPFFLEPLTYSPDPAKEKITGAEKRSVVVETARRLSVLGADVMKMEFPLDICACDDKKVWQDACQELSDASKTPWVLLSAGVNCEEYIDQVKVACGQGASGIAVGRAVWKEAVSLSGEERQTFLSTTARDRMRALNNLCCEAGKPWTDFYQPHGIGENWYEQY